MPVTRITLPDSGVAVSVEGTLSEEEVRDLIEELEPRLQLSRPRSALGSAVQAVGQVAADTLKAVEVIAGEASPTAVQPGAVAPLVGELPQTFTKTATPTGEEGPLSKVGDKMLEVSKRIGPTNPRFAGEFLTDTLPSGAGSMAAFAAAAPARATMAVAALSSGARAYEEAVAAGAEEDDALLSFLLNAGVGTTEAVPLGRIFRRINKATEGSLSKAIGKMVASGAEELTQEVVQQTLGNVIAKNLTDEERDVFEGVGEGGAAGGILGFLMAAAGIGGKRLAARKKVASVEGATTSQLPVKKGQVTSFVNRYFTKERGLPDGVYEAWRQREGKVNVAAVAASHASLDLERALAKYHGVGKVGQFVGDLSNVPVNTIRAVDGALKDPTLMNMLPEELRAPTKAMRSHIDALSSILVDEGLIDAKLAETIGDNIGTYLNRSYRVFDDPKWVYDNVPTDIRNKAKAFVREQRGISEEQAESLLRDMFADWKEGGVDTIFGKSKLGAKNLKQFIKRKDIAPEIRSLMGEHHDPFLNYTRSVSKVARFAADQQFLNDVRQLGMGKWLFEEGNNPPGFNSQIAAEGSRTMSPLNGLRTTDHIAKVFNDFNKSDMPSNGLWKLYHAINTTSKMSKTVYSIKTQDRNLLGQPFFWLMNGHVPTTGMKQAVQAAGAEFNLSTKEGAREFQKELARVGLWNESAFSGELNDAINDFSQRLTEQSTPFDYSAWTFAKQLAVTTPMKAYRASDQLGKAVGYMNELGRVKKMMPDATVQQQKMEAAARVRNTYPTYSNVPDWLKEFRKVPVIGPFVSFAYESFRTTFHAANYMRQAFAQGRLAEGTERAIGMTAALAGSTYGLQKLSQLLLGITDEEDKDLRRFLPPWSKNSPVFYRDKGEGELEFINLGYANPYSYMVEPFVAGMASLENEEPILQAMAKGLGEMLTPWTNEQMLAGALIDVKRNKTQDGREVWNEQDTPNTKFNKMAGHMWGAVEPGTANRFRRKLVPALRGDGSVERTPLSIALGEVTGFDVQRVNYLRAADFRAGQFRDGLRNARSIFTKRLFTKGSRVDPIEQYKDAERARWRLFTEMHRDVMALRRRGVQDQAIFNMLTTKGIAAGDAGAVMKGSYNPYVPSVDVIKRANNAGNLVNLQQLKDLAKTRSKYVLVD